MNEPRIAARLRDPALYEEQIRRLVERGHEAQQEGATLHGIAARAATLARILADEVPSGRYRPSEAQRRVRALRGKRRVLYQLKPTDHVVCGAVARAIAQVVYPSTLTTSLYSYRDGRSSVTAVAALARHVRSHVSARALPNERGLYVLRRDVQDYTDSIPTAEDSPLWGILRHAIGGDADSFLWPLLHALIRPEVRDGDERCERPQRGIPTGTPICPVVYNLYLGPLDRQLSAIEGGFYARFSDDILFAHPDACEARRVDRMIDVELARCGLHAGESKRLDLFFNGAGRSSPAWSAARGATGVDFLGLRVDFRGVVSLTNAGQRGVLRELRRRTRRAAALMTGRPLGAAMPVLCAVANQCADVSHPLSHRYASALRQIVTDRTQLQQLDYEIAQIVAEALSGVSGVRAFRSVAPRVLREQGGLISLVAARNAVPNGRTERSSRLAIDPDRR